MIDKQTLVFLLIGIPIPVALLYLLLKGGSDKRKGLVTKTTRISDLYEDVDRWADGGKFFSKPLYAAIIVAFLVLFLIWTVFVK